MARVCEITGKKTQSGNRVSHANNKTKRRFCPNLQLKRVYLEEMSLWVSVRLSTAAFRTIKKQGFLTVLKKAAKKGTLAPSLQKLVSIL